MVGALLIFSGTLEDSEISETDIVGNAKKGIWTVIFVFLGNETLDFLFLRGFLVIRLFCRSRANDVYGTTPSHVLEIDSWNLCRLLFIRRLDSFSRFEYITSFHESKRNRRRMISPFCSTFLKNWAKNCQSVLMVDNANFLIYRIGKRLFLTNSLSPTSLDGSKPSQIQTSLGFRWGKAMMIRDHALLWVLSIAFEFMEITFQHWLPNFNECWWDSWILDVAVCNCIGIYAGMWTVRLFDCRYENYNWMGISRQKTLIAKCKRSFQQLLPYSWDKYKWDVNAS